MTTGTFTGTAGLAGLLAGTAGTWFAPSGAGGIGGTIWLKTHQMEVRLYMCMETTGKMIVSALVWALYPIERASTGLIRFRVWVHRCSRGAHRTYTESSVDVVE